MVVSDGSSRTRRRTGRGKLNVSLPAAEEQVRFILDLQRLLGEGAFVSTYKFALLWALADLSVERGADSGNALTLSTKEIAEKFIRYYWKQTLPYPSPEGAIGVLRQNTGKEAEVVTLLARAREKGSLAEIGKDIKEWTTLVSKVAQTIEKMPLWKLQTMGRQEVPFLYENLKKGNRITLRPGVAYNFRRFYGFIQSLIQNAWIRQIRRIRPNQEILGQATDLQEFLFGPERNNLSVYRPALLDLQSGSCFYCKGNISGPGDVDHFVPWTLYPLDLAHNLVVAHKTCNMNKSDYLPAVPHLERWVQRNEDRRNHLTKLFNEIGAIHNLPASFRVTRWAYEQAETAGADVWLKGKSLCVLDPRWRELLVTT